jgi:hypothetical protein
MAAIIERPLLKNNLINFSILSWSNLSSVTDQTNFLAGSITYSEGGRLTTPGQPTVDVGTFTCTLKNAVTIPNVGDVVRLQVQSDNVFTGYIQDISQQIVFADSKSKSNPVIMTTLYCLDWVGYIGQFQAIGASGANVTTGSPYTTSTYTWQERIAALNLAVDGSYTTKIITPASGTPTTPNVGDTDFVGTFAEHLNLISEPNSMIWYGAHTIPGNKTTGRTGLVKTAFLSNLTSSTVTFTDAIGSTDQLHYTEIDFENTTQNIANTVIVNNRARLHVADVEVTKVGGFNETNYMTINGANVIGIPIETTFQATDATSITNNGIRQTEIPINVAIPPSSSGAVNLLANPSVEYSDDGYFGESTYVVRRRKPADDSSPFAAYDGQWAMRIRIKGSSVATCQAAYTGSESDGTPVIAGNTYYLYGYAARSGGGSRTDTRCRARIKWYDQDESVLSTVYGSQVTITSTNTWYQCASGAQVAPANAVRAQVALEFNRSGGGNFSAGDVYWTDALILTKSSSVTTYFDGDTTDTTTYLYEWTGGVGSSPSYRINNNVDDVATNILSRYSTTSMRASRIRWNVQENVALVDLLTVGSTISLIYKSTTNTYRIVGLDATVEPSRYMIDYYLAKV